MENIRAGSFETNSSSMHSIVFPKREDNIHLRTLSPDKDGIVRIYPGEFGWGPEQFRDPGPKASYCLTEIMRCIAGEVDTFTRQTIDEKPWLFEGQHDEIDRLARVIEEESNATVIFVASDDRYNEWGYIDHQSQGTAREVLHDEETLRNFIFNHNVVLVIDNDNRM